MVVTLSHSYVRCVLDVVDDIIGARFIDYEIPCDDMAMLIPLFLDFFESLLVQDEKKVTKIP